MMAKFLARRKGVGKMRIVSMEPTPSPYSLKVNVDEVLEDGKSAEYKATDDLSNAPTYIQKLFEIEGIKGLFRVVDFITIERDPRTDWEEIIPKVIDTIGAEREVEDLFSQAVHTHQDDAYEGVRVLVQMIRNIPTQVKLQSGDIEKRFALPERMMEIAMKAATFSEDYLGEREWVEQSPRYGDIDEIGERIVEELSATYSDERLEQLLELAEKNRTEEKEIPRKKVTPDMLDLPNWRDRFALLAQMPEPTEADYELLDKALGDENSSVRRLATAYLGMIESKDTLPYLYKALKDRSVNVRRTAGDCLSDLGYKEAIPEMIKTLKDRSRIVRWRGAMFLYEIGDESAIPALQEALEDPEFEVRMQAKMALARIESGEEARGSIWHQMERAVKED